ncbi:hypothetical protein JCM18237_23960 [Halorubrum luteum]
MFLLDRNRAVGRRERQRPVPDVDCVHLARTEPLGEQRALVPHDAGADDDNVVPGVDPGVGHAQNGAGEGLERGSLRV